MTESRKAYPVSSLVFVFSLLVLLVSLWYWLLNQILNLSIENPESNLSILFMVIQGPTTLMIALGLVSIFLLGLEIVYKDKEGARKIKRWSSNVYHFLLSWWAFILGLPVIYGIWYVSKPIFGTNERLYLFGGSMFLLVYFYIYYNVLQFFKNDRLFLDFRVPYPYLLVISLFILYTILIFPFSMSIFFSDVSIETKENVHSLHGEISVVVKSKGYLVTPDIKEISINDAILPVYDGGNRKRFSGNYELHKLNTSYHSYNSIGVKYKHPYLDAIREKSQEITVLID